MLSQCVLYEAQCAVGVPVSAAQCVLYEAQCAVSPVSAVSVCAV